MDRTRTVARQWGRRVVGLAIVLSLAAGCGQGGGGRLTDSAEQRTERAKALIESGNEAYRDGDYRLAVRRFAAAAVVRKDEPAAYYGLGMALSKLGRDEEARQAYARARELAQTARESRESGEGQ